VFKVGLESYIIIVTIRRKQSTFQQHKEATMLCEKKMIIVEARNAL
jgi:hypothetical protein